MAERKREVQAAGELYRLLAENVKDYAIFVVDVAGRVQTWTPGAERMLGYRDEEILGRSASVVFTPEDIENGAPEKELEKARATGRAEDDRWHVRKDGSRFWASGVMTPLWAEDGTLRGFAKIMRDRTDWKRSQDALRESEARSRSLMDQAPFSIQVFAPDGRTIRVNRAWEELWGVTLDQIADYNILHDPQLEARGVLPLVKRAFAGEAVRIPAIEYDPNETLPDRTRYEDPRRWTAAVAYPLKDAHGQIREVVLIHEDITDRKRAEDLLHEELQRRRVMEERLTALVDASATLTDRLEPAFVLSSALRLFERLLPADAYAVWRFYAESRRWRIVAASGLSEQYQQATIRVLEQTPRMPDAPVVADDVFDLPILAERKEMYRAEGIRSLLATPLRIHGETCGTFVVYHRRPHRFSEVEVRLASAVANLSAAAIGSADLYEEQARLITQAQASEERFRFLADASAALARVVDYESTLQKVARLAVPSFADWCAVDMLDENGALRRLGVAHVDPAKVELAHDLHRRYPPDPDAPQGVWSVIRTGRPEIVPEITDELLASRIKDPERLCIIRELGLKSYIGVPIAGRGKVLGAITFIAAESGRRYDARDLTVAEDLAHRAAVAVENARLYHALREADRRKDEFLAMLAHELRNPLAPLRTGLDLLALSGAEHEVVWPMRQQVEHLVRLVDDLLDLSRIMRGRVELRKEPVELASVVARAADTARPLIDAHQQQFSVELPSEPVWLNADPVRLAQVIANLLNNASKYTERGGRIRLTAQQQRDTVVVRVRDTGVGIEPELLPRVFEIFTQATRSIDRSQGGLGIGLTVVKTLVEMHGGSVTAHSEGPGRGSEFTLRLPARTSVERAEAEAISPASAPARRVLIVDDNLAAAKMLSLLLEKLGEHQVFTAHDGAEALEAAEEHRPDLILLDIGLPKLDGYEVARQLRQREEFEQTLVVALTGYGTMEDRRKSLASGFDEHLVKPPGVEALQRLLVHPKLASE